jgi:hypothetical protein
LACCCQIIKLKSKTSSIFLFFIKLDKSIFGTITGDTLFVKISIIEDRSEIGIILIPEIKAASYLFSSGTKTNSKLFSFANITAGRIQLIERNFQSSASSHKKIDLFNKSSFK